MDLKTAAQIHRDRYQQRLTEAEQGTVVGEKGGQKAVEVSGETRQLHQTTTGAIGRGQVVAVRGDSCDARRSPPIEQRREEIVSPQPLRVDVGYVFRREVLGKTPYVCPPYTPPPPSTTPQAGTSYVYTWVSRFQYIGPFITDPNYSEPADFQAKLDEWITTGVAPCRPVLGRGVPEPPAHFASHPFWRLRTWFPYDPGENPEMAAGGYTVSYFQVAFGPENVSTRPRSNVRVVQKAAIWPDVPPTPPDIGDGFLTPIYRTMAGSDTFCLANPGIPPEAEPPESSYRYYLQAGNGAPIQLRSLSINESIDAPALYWSDDRKPVVAIAYGNAANDGYSGGGYCRVGIFSLGTNGRLVVREFRRSEWEDLLEYLTDLKISSPLRVKIAEFGVVNMADLVVSQAIPAIFENYGAANFTNYNKQKIWIVEREGVEATQDKVNIPYSLFNFHPFFGVIDNSPEFRLIIKGFAISEGGGFLNEKKRKLITMPGVPELNDQIFAVGCVGNQ